MAKKTQQVAAEVVQDDNGNPPAVPQELVVKESDNALMVLGKMAMLRDANPEALRAVADIRRDEMAHIARIDLHSALARAKGAIAQVPITKNASGYGYQYADLAHIKRVVDPALAAEGLSYSYDEFPADGGNIRSVITIRGYGAEVQTEKTAPPFDGTKQTNNVQAAGAHSTYLHRYVLCSALGIAATADNDGATPQPAQATQKAPPKETSGEVDWHKINSGKKAAREQALAEGKWLGGDSLTKAANSELLKAAIKVGNVKNADELSLFPAGKMSKTFYAAMKEVGLIGSPDEPQYNPPEEDAQPF